MNTSLLKTVSGRSIVLEYDVVSPRPYSRGNLVSGTGGIFQGYPSRLALDEPGLFGLEATSSHDWLGDTDMGIMRERFTHPLWAQLREKAAGAGHGGMDFVMNYRLLDCLRRGVTPDSVVYDAAAWSCLQELSALSVANRSVPVGIPDFTRGAWKELGKHALKGGGE
jgi:hypothetical protein